MDLKERELQTYNHSDKESQDDDDDNDDRYRYNEINMGDAIMTSPSDNSGDDSDADCDHDLLPSIDGIGTKSNKSIRSLSRNKSNRSKSYKSKRGKYRNKLRFAASGVVLDKDRDIEDERLPPTSTRVVFNRSKSNTKNDMVMLMQQTMYDFEAAETTTEHTMNNDMANVVMLNYDSSPEMQMADVIHNAVAIDVMEMNIEHNRSFKNENPDCQWNKSRKSTDFTPRLPDFVHNLSNKASNKSNKSNKICHIGKSDTNGKSRPSSPRLRLKLKTLTSKRKTRSDGESRQSNKSSPKTDGSKTRPSTARMIAAFRKNKKTQKTEIKTEFKILNKIKIKMATATE